MLAGLCQLGSHLPHPSCARRALLLPTRCPRQRTESLRYGQFRGFTMIDAREQA